MKRAIQLCESCKWWDSNEDGMTGECKRNAPSPLLTDGENCDEVATIVIHWPNTSKRDWCGEWTANKPVDKPFPWNRASVRLLKIFETQLAFKKPATMKQMAKFGAGKALELRNCGDRVINEIAGLLDEPWKRQFMESYF